MSTDPTSEPRTIIVCVKYTPDVEEIKVDPVTGGPNLQHASYRINDFDENGIEAALQLRDAHGGRVLGISVSSERPPENLLLRPLAMGIDELHLVCDAALRECDAFATAAVLTSLARKLDGFDIVVCSDTSVDEYRGEVGPRLAEALGLPAVTHVTRVALDGTCLRVERALESWLETCEVELPVVITVGSETNDPHMPTLRQLMQAGQKPVVEWQLAALVSPETYLDAASRIKTLATYAPPSLRKRIAVNGESAEDTARTLVRHLLEEAVVKF